ncbi:hypothetical protein BMI90_18355 [Thioclava sp. L04-15]|nr:hypothetical protein BMI90_18355 [Thioclava sp. L04-15]
MIAFIPLQARCAQGCGQIRSFLGFGIADDAHCGIRLVLSCPRFRGKFAEEAVQLVFAGHVPSLFAGSGPMGRIRN